MNSQFGRTGEAASTAIGDIADAAQEKVSETVGQAQAIAQEQYDRVAASIRRNPLQAAGIAAGVGFLLALLARR